MIERDTIEAILEREAISKQMCLRLEEFWISEGGKEWSGCFCTKFDRKRFFKKFKTWYNGTKN